jgi:hypothetical protein
MQKSILLSLLPPEIWHYYIYRTEHQLIFQDVVQDLRERVVHVEVDHKNRTFIVCNGENPYSVLAVF